LVDVFLDPEQDGDEILVEFEDLNGVPGALRSAYEQAEQVRSMHLWQREGGGVKRWRE
jgi:hypothetical protein